MTLNLRKRLTLLLAVLIKQICDTNLQLDGRKVQINLVVMLYIPSSFLYINHVLLFPSNVCPWFAVDFVCTPCRHEPSIYAKDRLLRTCHNLVFVEQFLKRFLHLFEHFDGLQKKVEPTSMIFCGQSRTVSEPYKWYETFQINDFLSKHPREFDWPYTKWNPSKVKSL